MVGVGSDRLGDVHVRVAPAVRQPGLAERADAPLAAFGRRCVAAYRQVRLEDRRPPVRDGFVTDDERREALRLRAPAEREGPVDRLVRPVEGGREVAECPIGGVGGEAECDMRGHDRLDDRVTDDDRVEFVAALVDQDRRTVLGGRADRTLLVVGDERDDRLQALGQGGEAHGVGVGHVRQLRRRRSSRSRRVRRTDRRRWGPRRRLSGCARR